MSYEFVTLYSQDIFFNCDVRKSCDGRYMGSLYILNAEEIRLLDLGIQKEWFLACEFEEFLICGHINTQGEWSLSPYRSLEPALIYTTKDKILDYVFSHEYSQCANAIAFNYIQLPKYSQKAGKNPR